MKLSRRQTVAEIHVVASVKERTLTRYSKGMYKFKMSLPKYAMDSFGHFPHGIRFLFYKSKQDTEPYMVSIYGHSHWIIEDDFAEIVVMKTDMDNRIRCSKVTNKWLSYRLPVQFGILDRTVYGMRSGDGMFCLKAKRVEVLLKSILSVFNRCKKKETAHFYCGEEIAELEQIYKENIELFVKSAIFKGVKNVYIGHSRLFSPLMMPTFGHTFEKWISSWTTLLGNNYTEEPDGLSGGSGNSKSLQYYNLHLIFPPEFYGKFYSFCRKNNKIKQIHFPEKYRREATTYDRQPDATLTKYKIIRTNYNETMANRHMVKPEAPSEALNVYEDYLTLRELFFKKAGKYLYEQGYHVIESKWNSRYEVMIFSNSDYTKTCRIRLDENSDQLTGVWINKLSSYPFVDIHSEDPEIKSYLENIKVEEDVTFIDRMAYMLDQVRYITMSEKTLARLTGNG